MHLTTFGLALMIAFVPAVCFYPIIACRRGVRISIVLVLEAIVWSAPLLLPRATFLRLLAGVLATMPAVKMWDMCVAGPRGAPRFVEYLLYLPNPFNVVWRRVAAECRPRRRSDLRRIAFGIPVSAGAVWICYTVFALHWRTLPFTLEHCTKVPALFLVILVAANTFAAGYRLIGIPSADFSNNFFLARTPAEFWRRYNRPAGQFLHEDVFKPLGGMRFPVLGALATFAISGLIHELLFDIAVWRVQGYQLAFFLVQGVAAIITARLRPTGWRAVIGVLATLSFNLATGLLFFASVNEVVPFYARRFR